MNSYNKALPFLFILLDLFDEILNLFLVRTFLIKFCVFGFFKCIHSLVDFSHYFFYMLVN